MSSRPHPALLAVPAPLLVGAVFGAFVVGAGLAISLPLGLGLLLAVAYGTLAVVNLPLALAAWVALLFVEHLPATSIAPSAGAMALAVAWVGTLRTRGTVSALARRHLPILVLSGLLLAWLGLSTAWAQAPAAATGRLTQWALAVATILVVTTAISSPRHLRFTAGAYVLGAVLSVAVGLAASAIGGATGDATTVTQVEGRLAGGAGDPNYLAAGLVPAMAIAGALVSGARTVLLRGLTLAALGLLGIGLAATQSRGGFLAALVAMLVAVVIYKRRRWHVVLFVVLAMLAAGAFFAGSPEALDRVTSAADGGNGRTDLWRVAVRVTEDHPLVGVGLGNFPLESRFYVRQPGTLEYVDLIADRAEVVHNVYLELLAETGVVGVLLFLGVVVACLRAAWRAAKRFEAMGDLALADLSRAVFVGVVSVLVAMAFLSIGPDRRAWILFALGPALLAISHRAAPFSEG